MADNRRNNVAGRVATPRTAGSPAPANSHAGAQPPHDQIEALGKAIGARVKITTSAPQFKAYEGILYTACPITNIVAINTRPSATAAAQAGDYLVFPTSRVQSFQIISGAENGNPSSAPKLGPADLKRLKDREQARIVKLKADEEARGKGVSKEGQAIFDSLRRINMPVRWHDRDIIVHDSVIISPEYRPEDCRGPKDKQETLTRVRKVLEGERRKLQERDERERKTASAAAGRKGG